MVNFDTGAAVTAVPLSLERSGLLKGDSNPSDTSYRTASGELLGDRGGVVVEGYDNHGFGRSVEGRLIDVHRMLASGTAVSKKNVVLLDGNSGHIIPKGGKIAQGLRASFQELLKQYPGEAQQLTELYEQKGIFVFDLWLNGMAKEFEALGAVGQPEGFKRQVTR